MFCDVAQWHQKSSNGDKLRFIGKCPEGVGTPLKGKGLMIYVFFCGTKSTVLTSAKNGVVVLCLDGGENIYERVRACVCSGSGTRCLLTRMLFLSCKSNPIQG